MTEPGQTVGNYRLVAKLGEGGMGEVFRGVDETLGRTVAIKALHPELARREDLVARFREEAMILARLNHPNIAALFSFFREGGQWFMVMEYAPGETLDRLIAGHRHGMPWQRTVGLITKCLQALEHAHAQGVVHRDLKPSNIMVSARGSVKVMDFGIARLVGGDRLTRTGCLVGTPAYMTPEQIQLGEADARSDLYSLGIVLYEMLLGQPPFRAGSDYALLKAQVESPLPPLRKRVPQLPVALEQALERALAKQPEARFQTALDFRLALEVLSSSAAPPQPTRILPVSIPPTRYGVPSQATEEEDQRRDEAAEARSIAEEKAQRAESEATGQTKNDEQQPEAMERERRPGPQEVERHAGEKTRLAGEIAEYPPDEVKRAVAPTVAAISPEEKPTPQPGSEGLEPGTVARQVLREGEQAPRRETPKPRRLGRYVAVGLPAIAGVALAITVSFLLVFREDPEISRLIQQAQEALAAGRLTKPEGKSAVSYVGRVLDMEPKHVEARRILHLAIDALLQKGLAAVRKGDVQKAVEIQQQIEHLIGSYHAIGIDTSPLTGAIRTEQKRRAVAEEERLREAQEAEKKRREEEARLADEAEKKRQAEAEERKREEDARVAGEEAEKKPRAEAEKIRKEEEAQRARAEKARLERERKAAEQAKRKADEAKRTARARRKAQAEKRRSEEAAKRRAKDARDRREMEARQKQKEEQLIRQEQPAPKRGAEPSRPRVFGTF